MSASWVSAALIALVDGYILGRWRPLHRMRARGRWLLTFGLPEGRRLRWWHTLLIVIVVDPRTTIRVSWWVVVQRKDPARKPRRPTPERVEFEDVFKDRDE